MTSRVQAVDSGVPRSHGPSRVDAFEFIKSSSSRTFYFYGYGLCFTARCFTRSSLLRSEVGIGLNMAFLERQRCGSLFHTACFSNLGCHREINILDFLWI